MEQPKHWAPQTLVLQNSDLLAHVFNYLCGMDLIAASAVCRTWNEASRFVSRLHVDASLLESHVLSSFLADLPFRFPAVRDLRLASSAGDALLVSPHTDLDFIHTFDSPEISSLELYAIPDVAENSYWFGLRNVRPAPPRRAGHAVRATEQQPQLVVWLGGHRATLKRLCLRAEAFPPQGRRYQHPDDFARRRQLVADPVVHRLAPSDAAPGRPRPAGAESSDGGASSDGAGDEGDDEAGVAWEAFRRLSDGSDDGALGGAAAAARRAAAREAAAAAAAIEELDGPDPQPFAAPLRALVLRLTGHGPADPLPGCRTLARGVTVGPAELDAGRLAALLRRLPLLESLELSGLSPAALAAACGAGLRCSRAARLRLRLEHDVEDPADDDDDEEDAAAAAGDGAGTGAGRGLFARGLPAAFPALRRLEWRDGPVPGQCPEEPQAGPAPSGLPRRAAPPGLPAPSRLTRCAACKRAAPSPPLECAQCGARYHAACLGWPPGADARAPRCPWHCGACALDAPTRPFSATPPAAGPLLVAPSHPPSSPRRAPRRRRRGPAFRRTPYRVVLGPGLRCTGSVRLAGSDADEPAGPAPPARAAGRPCSWWRPAAAPRCGPSRWRGRAPSPPPSPSARRAPPRRPSPSSPSAAASRPAPPSSPSSRASPPSAPSASRPSSPAPRRRRRAQAPALALPALEDFAEEEGGGPRAGGAAAAGGAPPAAAARLHRRLPRRVPRPRRAPRRRRRRGPGDEAEYLPLSAALPPSVRALRAGLPAASPATHVHAADPASSLAELDLALSPSVRLLSAESGALLRLAARLPRPSALESLELRCPALAEAVLSLCPSTPPPPLRPRPPPPPSPPRGRLPPGCRGRRRCRWWRAAARCGGCPRGRLPRGRPGRPPPLDLHGRPRTGFPRLRRLALGPLRAASVRVASLPLLESLELEAGAGEVALGGGLPALRSLRLAARSLRRLSLDLDAPPEAPEPPPAEPGAPCSPSGSCSSGLPEGRGAAAGRARGRGGALDPDPRWEEAEGEEAEEEAAGGAGGAGEVEGSVRAGPGTHEVALPFLPADFRRCFLPQTGPGEAPAPNPIRSLACREAPGLRRGAPAGPPASCAPPRGAPVGLVVRVACGLDLLARLEVDAPARTVRRLHVALPLLREAAIRLAGVEAGPARFDCPALASLSVALCGGPGPRPAPPSAPAPPRPAPPASFSSYPAPGAPPPPPPDAPLWYDIRAPGLRRARLERVDARATVLNGVAIADLRHQYRLLRGTRRDAARGMLEIVGACQALLWKCPVLFAPCADAAPASGVGGAHGAGCRAEAAAGAWRGGWSGGCGGARAARAGPGRSGGEDGPCCIPLLELDSEALDAVSAIAASGAIPLRRHARHARRLHHLSEDDDEDDDDDDLSGGRAAAAAGAWIGAGSPHGSSSGSSPSSASIDDSDAYTGPGGEEMEMEEEWDDDAGLEGRTGGSSSGRT
eukprot:tig00000403_g274.t1